MVDPQTLATILNNLMVSFRNRVVDLYWEVDENLLYRILQDNLGDFEKYIKYILDSVQIEGSNTK